MVEYLFLDGLLLSNAKYLESGRIIDLNLYSILINKIIITTFMTMKVSQNLNSMQKMRAQ